MEQIFRAYDIRGIWNKDLDPGIALDIGRSAGSFMKSDLKAKSIAVGYDVRTSSKSLEGALVSGLLATGLNVLSVGGCSFGTAMMAGWREGAQVSAYITASHLPPEWNGLKLYFGDGVGFPEENIIAIKDRFLSRDFLSSGWKDIGKYRRMDYTDRYVDFWKERYLPHISRKGSNRIDIAVDCGGGATCLSAPRVFSALGVKARGINIEVDPTFSGRPSKPDPSNLKEMEDTVKKEGLEFGIAFDGDGDRAVTVDDTGRFLSSDRMGLIIARDLVLENGGGVVLANVESSMAVEDVLTPLGADVVRIRVGHTFLTLEAKKRKALFGMEKSGHIIVPHHVLFDDAMVAPLELLRIINKEDKPLSEIGRSIPQYPSFSKAFDCPDENKFSVVKSLTDDLKDEYDSVNTMDGARVDTDRGWVLIRPSNTSPVIRMTVEGRNEDGMKAMADDFNKRLTEKIP
jgi:phosphomannomutase